MITRQGQPPSPRPPPASDEFDIDTLPFAQALGDAAHSLPDELFAHFVQPSGTRTYAGHMSRIWRARGVRGVLAWPGLWLASRMQTLFPETGNDVPFEIEHQVYRGSDGRVRMSWTRTFFLATKTRRFDAVMVYDPQRQLIDDRLGTGRLETELLVSEQGGAVVITSARQWLHVAGMRLRIPAILSGRAVVREWQQADGATAIHVTVSNPWLGDIFGYEGSFRPKP